MGLRQWLVRRAVSGAHVLVVEAPGAWQVRVAAEQAVTRRGWRLAWSPADADVLLVCGHPGPQLTEVLDRVWDQLPGPRACVVALAVGEVGGALDQARSWLLDDPQQRDEAAQRPLSPAELEDTDGEGDADGDDHGDMDHGDMDMSGPGGIALAMGGDDRDGLAMDVLHLPLGPVLPHWPPGLVLHCALQGDVITEAQVEVLDSTDDPTDDPTAELTATQHAARRCDAAVDLLALAGWDALVVEARLMRDRLLAEDTDQAAALHRLRDRVTRSRTLRWSLRGLGRADSGGDTYDRLLDLLADEPTSGHSGRDYVETLPQLVTGLDLAAARLVVASLAPMRLRPAAVPSGGGHG